MDSSFTLIELLIVVAIIGVLASLLLPALSASKASVRKISCASNMRQVFQGCLMYVNDNNEWLPPTDDASYGPVYVGAVNSYLSQSFPGGFMTGYGRIYFAKQRGVYFCPSASDPPETSAAWNGGAGGGVYYLTSYMPTCSYSTTDANANSSFWGLSVGNLYRRFSGVTGNCAMMGDKDWTYLAAWGGGTYYCNSVGVGYAKYLVKYGEAPGWRHSSQSNFVFKDGHVQSVHYTGNDPFQPGGFMLK